mgnify:CR=1 FL=1
MRFRNAIYITADNYSSAFKMLLYRLIVGILTFSLVYVILQLSLSVIMTSPELQNLKDLATEFFRALFGGDSVRLETFRPDFTDALADFFALVTSNGGAIAGAVVGVCLMYILSRFLNGLCHFAAANIMHDRMSVFARTSFSAAFFKNLGNAALYQVIYVPVSFVYDALSLLTCWFFFFYLPSFLPSWGFLTILLALSFTVALYICLQSLKMTLISAWIPSVLTGEESVAKGLRASFHKVRPFWRRFVSYLTANYLIVVVNVVFGLATLGSALLITIPLSFLFLLALQCVHYYEDNGKKYFISIHNIAGAEGAPVQGIETSEDSLEELNKKINAEDSVRNEDNQ